MVPRVTDGWKRSPPLYGPIALSLRGSQALKKRFFSVLFFILLNNDAKRLQNFFYRLVKLRLRRVLRYYALIDFIYIRHAKYLHKLSV